jgi:hypothetical protein
MSALLTILKLAWPTTWLKAIFKEAETTPATVSGIMFLWVTFIAAFWLAFYTYENDALANEAKFEVLQTTLAAATEEIECAKDDRNIAAKTRAIQLLLQLIEITTAPVEKREQEYELAMLQRELANLERVYQSKCF